MGSDARTGERPAVPEDTIDLRERLDPVRTLLHRASAGDRRAAGALVDVLAPRIHGLAAHATGSSARAERLTVSVLRSCLRDAGDLAAGVLPGEVAVLDRARRAVVATRPSGDVPSLLDPGHGSVEDRTSDRREIDVLRTLLALPPSERALVESAAQGRFPYSGSARRGAAEPLARALDRLRPLGGPAAPEVRGLAALDALALADAEERERLQELTASPESASIHLHAIEAAAALTLLTAVAPSRALHSAVLEDIGAGPRTDADAEAAYGGSYSTPVLGTDTQRRMVGPPAMPGGVHGSAAEPSALSPGAPGAPRADGAPGAEGAPVREEPGAATAPAFAFRRGDEKERSRRDRRREEQRARDAVRAPRGIPWISRSVAALATVCALVLGGLLLSSHQDLEASRDFSAAWIELSLAPGAETIDGLSDNGSWRAVLSTEGTAVRAEGVVGWDGEVLELWGESEGSTRSLGILDVADDGTIEFTGTGAADRLFVTREMAPRSESGTPSPRVVATFGPAATGGDG
ncbi:hypothetical protein ACT3SP_06280 [Brachybacterium sp. AOP43-C2-M15]|uniref:hypothetical protein n=1 Tax=Brachybacterium sp. AOP43-C2-M15 TaxID=3457661 RepID=UPI004033A31B